VLLDRWCALADDQRLGVATPGAVWTRWFELLALGLLSAFLCGLAMRYEQQVAAAVFAALACTTTLMAVALRRLS